MTTNRPRPELADIPLRMQGLPIDARGYPVPRFVEWRDGEPDFRIMSQEHWLRCVKQGVCWVCGYTLGAFKVFVAGPMCLVNMTSSEPPSHRECARWSARSCPFLARPHARRREDELTEQCQQNVAGCPILRNPGVTALVVTRGYTIWRDDQNRPLIEMGAPVDVEWFREGRPATRAEVLESIDSGMPLLRPMAEAEGAGAVAALERKRREVERWIPAA